MKEFISHIDYLIQKNDCVIIPGFGGFVISHEGASIATNGSIMPPKVSVGFNPDLKSNDGLLAESYMTMYSISYDEASQRIEEAVKRLNIILGMKHPVQIGRLGKLSLDNNKLTFSPNANLSIFHPDTFGLSKVNMKRLADIDKDRVKVKRQSLVKRVFAGAGVAAAAVVIFFIASTPVSVTEDTQKSSFLSDLTSSFQKTEANISKVMPAEVTPNDVNREVEAEPNESQAEQIPSAMDLETSVTEPSNDNEEVSVDAQADYYVVIAGATSQSEAERLISRFESQGLTNLCSVASRNRIRIYTAAFNSREKAEEYLVDLKKENPQLHDAWVYHKE